MKRVIYPIFPSFINDELDLKTTESYISYLNGFCLMTTAGSSQFNLLTNDEINKLNNLVIEKSIVPPIVGLPPTSLKNTKIEISKLNEFKCNPLILFPERYYSDEQVFDFYQECAEFSKNGIYFHASQMRRGNGGNIEYSSKLINLLSSHKNIIGMKEENSSISEAYNDLQEISNNDFEIIVAGGSMRRSFFLSQASENISHLSGLGSIFPEIENKWYISDDKYKKKLINLENILFKVFMEIGWHASIRYSLQRKGFIRENRKPFIELSKSDKNRIEDIIKIIEKCIEDLVD